MVRFIYILCIYTTNTLTPKLNKKSLLGIENAQNRIIELKTRFQPLLGSKNRVFSLKTRFSCRVGKKVLPSTLRASDGKRNSHKARLTFFPWPTRFQGVSL